MATRLTAFSKFVITLVILGVIGGGVWYVFNKTAWGQNQRKKAEELKTEGALNEAPRLDLRMMKTPWWCNW